MPPSLPAAWQQLPPCELPCDVLVFCTGYLSKTLELLDPPSRAKAEADLPWYENVFVPSLPGVAFMGAATSLWWFLELQAEWISGVWSGRCDLPSADTMQVWLRNVRQWQAEVQASLPRKRKMLIPETPLASAVRLAKASGQPETEVGLFIMQFEATRESTRRIAAGEDPDEVTESMGAGPGSNRAARRAAKRGKKKSKSKSK